MPVSKIGRYEVEDELGQGGMAVVYLARDPYMRRQVAIKVLAYQLTSDSVSQEHFYREAEIIAALEHPCIVPVFDFGLHGRQPYIVMRYMANGSLEDRLRKGELKLTQLARIISRVAEGLDAAHAQGVVHRDVKPSNILFDTSDEAFLSDFGVAKSLYRSAEPAGTMFVGTPGYMSPEQVRDEQLDGRSDVYALGVVLYRALTGQMPHERSPVAAANAHTTEGHVHGSGGGSGTERLRRLLAPVRRALAPKTVKRTPESSDVAVPLQEVYAPMTGPVPNVLDVKPDLPSAWGEIIGQATAQDPAGRYATAGALALEVREIVSGRWYLRKLVDD